MFFEDSKLVNITPDELVQKVDNPEIFHRLFNYSNKRRIIEARNKYKYTVFNIQVSNQGISINSLEKPIR